MFSLTSIIRKMLESTVKNVRNGHLDEDDVIGYNQHGFMNGISHLSTRLQYLEDVTDRIDNGEMLHIV